MAFRSKEKFNALCTDMAKNYGVESTAEMFDVKEPQAMKLEDKIQESDAFLAKTALITSDDQSGEIVTLTVPTTLAGRTDTSKKDREPVEVGQNTGREYRCEQVNYDSALRYKVIDAWGRFPDYGRRVLSSLNRREALDKLLIGWYGEDCQKDTDRVQFPLLQDVNYGWLYDLRENMPENYFCAASGQKITFGKTGDYRNLNAAVAELYSLIPVHYRTGREVAIIGHKLLAWENVKIYQLNGDKPSEMANMPVMGRRYGTLPLETPAGFPDFGIMVTDPENLQRYYQPGAIRRQLSDNPKRDRIENLHSVNEAYHIGLLEGAAAINYLDVVITSASDEAEEGSEG